MQRIILRELCFNNEKVIFNEGENYIIGSNGVGKTTLFYMIQYILGIRKSMPRMITPFMKDSLSLKVSFGNRLINIIRNFESDDIIFGGDIDAKVKVSSSALGDIYHELLQPNISKDVDRMVAIEILKLAFMSETNSYLSRRESNLFNKIIGINIELPNQIKREIDNFKKEIKLEETTNDALKNYIGRVEKVIRDECISKFKNKDIDYFVGVLEKEFTIMRNESLQNTLLVEEAEESLNKVNSNNEYLFKERSKLIESYFYGLIEQFEILSTVKIDKVFNNKSLSNSSFGQNILLRFLTLITLCRISGYEWHNASGLLVNDDMCGILDRVTIDSYRKIISEECRSGTLQYIEFGRYKKNISQEAIILDLNDRRFWYEKKT